MAIDTARFNLGQLVRFRGSWTEGNSRDFGFSVETGEFGTIRDGNICGVDGWVWYVEFPETTKRVDGHRGGRLTRTVRVERKVNILDRDLEALDSVVLEEVS